MSLLLIGSMFAQNVAPVVSITPHEINAVVDKATTDVLTWPVTVSLPPFPSADMLYVSANAYPILPPGITVSPATQLVTYNQSATFQVRVNPAELKYDIGRYLVPLTFTYSTTSGLNLSQSIAVNLDMIDSRLSQLPALSLRTIPHIAVGGGWKTTLRFVNPGDQIAIYRVSFLSTGGQPLPVFANGVYGAETAVTIFPKGVSLVSVTGPLVGNAIVTGHAEVMPQINGTGVGFNVAYEFPTLRGETLEAATPGADPHTDTLNLLYDLRFGNATGVALSNAMNYPQTVDLVFYDDLGRALQVSRIVLPAKGQTSFTVDKNANPLLAERFGVLVVKGQFKALSGLSLKFSTSGGFIPLTSF